MLGRATSQRMVGVTGLGCLLLAAAAGFADQTRSVTVVRGGLAAIGCIAVSLWLLRAVGTWALLAIPVILGALWTGPTLPLTGDEQHYLVIAESVVHDFDLAVDDEYRDDGNDERFGHRALRADGSGVSRYSGHLPANGLLLTPAAALDSPRIGRLIVGLIFGLALVEGALLCRYFGFDEWQALLAVVGLLACSAMLLHGRQLFPEGLGALCIAHLARLYVGSRTGHWQRWWPWSAGLAALVAPWTHLRFAAPAAAFYVALVVCERRARVAIWVPMLAIIAMFVLFDSWYGSWRPDAPYLGTRLFTGGPGLRAVVGLLVDGHVGLLFVAPVAVIGLLGVRSISRVDRLYPLLVFLPIVALIVQSTRSVGWSFGTSTPGRFWVALLIPMSPFVASSFQRFPTLGRVGIGIALATSTPLLARQVSAYRTMTDGRTTLWSNLDLPLPALTLPGHTPLWAGWLLVGIVGLALCAQARTPRAGSVGSSPS